jgi:hypothetical protein
MGLFDFIRRIFAGTSPSRRGTSAQARVDGIGQRALDRLRETGAAGMVDSASTTRSKTGASTKLAELDAGQFAPLSRKDTVRQARGAWLSSSAWWGRRDAIPPVSDKRTLLIDRTMVAYGLMTAEELVEIHKIGDQMLELKGDYALAEEQARQSIAASDAERQRNKEEKKAAAAERRRRRAEAVAQRKATDIIFLGRGVSRGLADRRANVEKLQSAGLPVLVTPADVAKALGRTIPRLRWLAFHSEATEMTHYIRFTVLKRSGGLRELAAPHRDLAAAQKWVLDSVLQKLPTHPAAHGFVRGHSIRTNALPHVGRQVLVNCDLKDFFPTITFPRVLGAFMELGYSPAAATIFALLCTEAPRRIVEYAGKTFHVATGPRALPQGACTSPAISNLIARRLDSRLAGLAMKLGWKYTRYADDLSFSSEAGQDSQPSTGYLLARVRHIAQDEGFVVNEQKTRVLKRSAAMEVTGVVVNRKPGVSRRERRRLRAILHNVKRHGLESQNRHNHPHFAEQLRGKIAFVQMINPDQARPLWEAFRAFEEP